MFIPYRTDAPVYHWPFSTMGLIVVNVAVSLALWNGGLGDNAAAALILQFGDGLHPLQWITSTFVHGDLLHLIGNMIFLWVFGLVVEGKVGWYRFLAIYLGLAAAEGALEQICLLGLPPGHAAYGASGVLFGLLAMALVWAPENEVSFFYWILLRPGVSSLKIRTAALAYLVLELLGMSLDALLGQAVGSSFLHLVGAAVGFPLGVFLLKAKLVDCEGWDLFSRMRKKPVRSKTKRASPEMPGNGPPAVHGPGGLEAPAKRAGEQNPAPAHRAEALHLLRDRLKEGDAAAARMIYQDTVKETGPWQLPAPDLHAMIRVLLKGGHWEDALPLLAESLERFPARSGAVRLLLGKVLLENASRPASAIEVLEAIPPGELSQPQDSHRQELIRGARRVLDQGLLELDVE